MVAAAMTTSRRSPAPAQRRARARILEQNALQAKKVAINSGADQVRGAASKAFAALKKSPRRHVAFRGWLQTPNAEGAIPGQVLETVANVMQFYPVPVIPERELELQRQLEAFRDSLGIALTGKKRSDIYLRNSRSLSRPVRAFADALTRACRSMADALDDGSASAKEAQAAGKRLSTRQAVELVCSNR